jgi:hypothetical protein
MGSSSHHSSSGHNRHHAHPPPPHHHHHHHSPHSHHHRQHISPSFSDTGSDPGAAAAHHVTASAPPGKSAFKNALKPIPVPEALHEGIAVIRVYANGKTKLSYMTLSEDKFTIYITSEKFKKKQEQKGSSVFASIFGKVAGGGGGSHHKRLLGGGKRNDGGYLGSPTLLQQQRQEQERAIDIGAIDSIQRGHATHRFELARYDYCDSYFNFLNYARRGSGTSAIQCRLVCQGPCFCVLGAFNDASAATKDHSKWVRI